MILIAGWMFLVIFHVFLETRFYEQFLLFCITVFGVTTEKNCKKLEGSKRECQAFWRFSKGFLILITNFLVGGLGQDAIFLF